MNKNTFIFYLFVQMVAVDAGGFCWLPVSLLDVNIRLAVVDVHAVSPVAHCGIDQAVVVRSLPQRNVVFACQPSDGGAAVGDMA